MDKMQRLFWSDLFIREIGWCEGEFLGVVNKRGVIDTTDLTAEVLVLVRNMLKLMH